jgi:hypothetical protein
MGMDAKLISAGATGALGSQARPEDFLFILAVLSPTLWLLVFLTCYYSSGFSSVFSRIFRALQFRQAPAVVTLFADGSPTSRPTLSR